MSKTYQAIVVGAGPAGASAALTMARAGLEVALVERGTTPEQRRVLTTLGDLVETIDREGFQPPALIVVGEVVRLADRFAPTVKPAVAAAGTMSMEGPTP